MKTYRTLDTLVRTALWILLLAMIVSALGVFG
jgi:hypothetical protein